MPSQHLGIVNTNDNGNVSNHLIAVELDTVQTIEFLDIDHNHVGVDVNSLISLNSSTEGYCYKDHNQFRTLTLMSREAMKVWIEYNGEDIYDAKTTRPKTLLVTSLVNFSNVVLEKMFVGFASSTGAAAAIHYVLGWSFSLHGTAQSLYISDLPSIPSNETQSNKGRHQHQLSYLLRCL
jgi:Legume lectin domain